MKSFPQYIALSTCQEQAMTKKFQVTIKNAQPGRQREVLGIWEQTGGATVASNIPRVSYSQIAHQCRICHSPFSIRDSSTTRKHIVSDRTQNYQNNSLNITINHIVATIISPHSADKRGKSTCFGYDRHFPFYKMNLLVHWRSLKHNEPTISIGFNFLIQYQ